MPRNESRAELLRALHIAPVRKAGAAGQGAAAVRRRARAVALDPDDFSLQTIAETRRRTWTDRGHAPRARLIAAMVTFITSVLLIFWAGRRAQGVRLAQPTQASCRLDSTSKCNAN